MGETAYTSKANGSLFIQTGGPNTEVEWLGCFDVDDITESEGAINLLFCIDENGKYQVTGFTEDPPDLLTFNMGTYFGTTKDVIEQAACPFGLYLAIICDGKKYAFHKWQRMVTAQILKRTGRTLTGIVRRNEDTEMMVSFEVSAKPNLIDTVRIRGYRQTVTEAENLNQIVFCNSLRCNGRCGNAAAICTSGMIVADAVAAGTANVLFSTDGVTWTAGSADPFAADEHISSGVCFEVDATTTRRIVARGVTDAGAPAELAYSDDNGASWTGVTVGSTNGDFVTLLYGSTSYNLWAVTNDGYIYQSTDGGVTWTARESGVLTSGGAILGIQFSDRLNGVATGSGDVVLYTTDGGLSWAAGSTGGGNNLERVTWNGLYWWITDDGGDMWYTVDHTGSWSLRTGYPGAGSANLSNIDWANEYVGIAGQSSGGSGYVLMTVDGGWSWSRLSMPTSTGINWVYMCGTDLAYAVGPTTSGTGFVAKITTS